MLSYIKKLIGTSHDRAVRKMRPRVARINDLEPEIKALTDRQLKAKTAEFKERLDNGATLDDLLSEAFAVVREAGRRTLNMRHFDVQLMGGMVLHKGAIAEMRTGEGKTLVATLPIYLNALEGKGVHLVTVNDYLARRDAEWMGKIYNFLGMSVGVVVGQQGETEKNAAYRCDVTYGQNNEFGFDYLRDNMKFSALDYHQRPLNFAIVDEVDSILIDEARTPLIISGQGERSSDKYRVINEIIPRLRNEEHYNVDEKGHSVTLTDDGVELAEQLLKVDNLYEPEHLETLHILNQCLRAHTLYKRDVNYMVREGKVMIIDEFTGRVLAGRRWSDGLHQAVEAKENVPIQEENRTLATITFQNLFRLYNKLSGMTGTADTEAAEFNKTYKIDVTVIPTNKPMIRADEEDVVYKTEREKFTALVDDIMENHDAGVPILVGTTSVEKSAAISRILSKKKVDHAVLNAKHHENEAYVVAQAGRLAAITVSTNMAGRGTDIILGGNPEMLVKAKYIADGRDPEEDPAEFKQLVEEQTKESEEEREAILELGGLYILGTERHEARRIDNQLRGRAGRQGDPGRSRFYLSLEDDLMRIFAGDRVKNLMERMGMPDGEPIEHPWVTKSVENAQKKVEERNFDIRKNLLEYDDVMSSQRSTVYSLRQQLLVGRYKPEEVDEEGKPTGHFRSIPLMEGLDDKVRPDVAALLGMFCEDPIMPRDKEGKEREIPRKEFEKASKLVELESLQKEIYARWGVKIEIDRRDEDALGIYDECVEGIPQALSEQRERALDLIDRIIGAMIEDLCPPNRVPDDWDWNGLFEGFEQHFGIELADEIADHSDRESLARELYDIAEEAYLKREEELGMELLLRVFRHIYLEELDRTWVDHLTDMDHLRDGIGLRGYGQKDPKQEYKKEGYNMFVNMMARVSSNVVTKMMKAQIRRADADAELEQMEADKLARHLDELSGAIARHGGEAQPASSPGLPAPPAVMGEEPCPCGSGKPFRKCHGSDLDFDEASP
ncbi:MAG: preprotein translocase subunit SecA [Deltaproteobacteria bacterium]|jgi:preprotein translocase subunit SecA|nr:preprotein translocase subunit SecA [Deltaproteobacteria bacterium]